MLMAALKGFLLMMSLIVAIGPQNAFLLRQAVRRDHTWIVATIMLCGDISMVAIGGFGIGHLLESLPSVKLALTILGAVYIFRFGWGVYRQIAHPKTLTIDSISDRRTIITTTLAVTFLNPHAIFETIVVIGSLALQFGEADKPLFLAGAMLGSTVWFFGIAWAGQKLAPYLSRPKVWRCIDIFIVIVMMTLAISLSIDAVRQACTLFHPVQ